jgi:hypothetical protein
MQGVTSAGDITITSEGGSATQSLQQGLAKMWVRMNNNDTLSDTFNISSLDDDSTGQFGLHYTNVFNNANYNGACGVGDDARHMHYPGAHGVVQTDQADGVTRNNSNVDTDAVRASITIHGDLA